MPRVGERWKDVVGYEGVYQVSNQGRVKSLRRTLIQPYRGAELVRSVCERILKPACDHHNYLFVGLYKSSVQDSRYVHHLVLEAFVGPSSGRVCRHFPDRNPANNRLENLCWGTMKENAADRNPQGTANKGERHGIAKLTNGLVTEIRRQYATGKTTQYKLAAEFGVHVMTINSVVRRKTWGHVP